MFSGKTEELIRRLQDAERSGLEIAACKPAIDRDQGRLVSRGGASMPAQSLDGTGDLVRIAHGASAIGVDEVQFLPDDVSDVLADVAARGVRVIVAGLDLDFRGVAFPAVALLGPRADLVTRMTARCARCGGRGTHSQRLIDGVPASRDEPVVRIGGAELYEPRCAGCHEVGQSPYSLRAVPPSIASRSPAVKRASALP